MPGIPPSIPPGKLYLAKYAEDGSLYRAEELSEAREDKVEVFFVDYGNSARVDLTDIWELNTISDVMSELPRQALKCRLSNVPPEGQLTVPTWSSISPTPMTAPSTWTSLPSLTFS